MVSRLNLVNSKFAFRTTGVGSLTDKYGNVRTGGQPGFELSHGSSSSTVMRTHWQPGNNWGLLSVTATK